MEKYTIYFISDGTGLTAETLGHALTSQFSNIEFERKTIPYIDTLEKAKEICEQINHHVTSSKRKAIIFTTLVDSTLRDCFKQCDAFIMDLFAAFLSPLENALQSKSDYTIGQTHGMVDHKSYQSRIDAINYALATDDGVATQKYKKADVILVGVSRSGKTPTSLYLALRFGILAANYPLTQDELLEQKIPKPLSPYKEKLFGLLIDPERLQSIRKGRRPDSKYASLAQCRLELNEAKTLYQKYSIPNLNTTHHSIEEIATKLLSMTNLTRRVY